MKYIFDINIQYSSNQIIIALFLCFPIPLIFQLLCFILPFSMLFLNQKTHANKNICLQSPSPLIQLSEGWASYHSFLSNRMSVVCGVLCGPQ